MGDVNEIVEKRREIEYLRLHSWVWTERRDNKLDKVRFNRAAEEETFSQRQRQNEAGYTVTEGACW